MGDGQQTVTVRARVPLPGIDRGQIVDVPWTDRNRALIDQGRLVLIANVAAPGEDDGPQTGDQAGPPAGTVDEVLAWVDADGTDAWARAGTAYHAEQQRGQPRSTLLDELSARLARAGGVPPPDGHDDGEG